MATASKPKRKKVRRGEQIERGEKRDRPPEERRSLRRRRRPTLGNLLTHPGKNEGDSLCLSQPGGGKKGGKTPERAVFLPRKKTGDRILALAGRSGRGTPLAQRKKGSTGPLCFRKDKESETAVYCLEGRKREEEKPCSSSSSRKRKKRGKKEKREDERGRGLLLPKRERDYFHQKGPVLERFLV